MRSTPDLIIGPAEASDIAAVEALLDAAAAWQESRGIPQWRPGQFGEEVRQTIADGDLYVGRHEGAVVGCFMLDDGSPPWTRWLLDHDRVPAGGWLDAWSCREKHRAEVMGSSS